MRCHLVAPINAMSTCGRNALSRINISYRVPPFHHNIHPTVDTLLIDLNLMELGCVFLKTHASTLSLDLSFCIFGFWIFFGSHNMWRRAPLTLNLYLPTSSYLPSPLNLLMFLHLTTILELEIHNP